MKVTMRAGLPSLNVAALAAALLVTTAAVAQSVPPAKAESPGTAKVTAVVNQLREAIRSGDVALAERVLAETVTIFEQGHVESSRAEYMGHHFKEDVAYAKLVPSKVVSVSTVIDAGMALVTATTTTDGLYKDKPVKSAGVETYVLRLRDGAWRIEHIHWSNRKRQ